MSSANQETNRRSKKSKRPPPPIPSDSDHPSISSLPNPSLSKKPQRAPPPKPSTTTETSNHVSKIKSQLELFEKGTPKFVSSENAVISPSLARSSVSSTVRLRVIHFYLF